MNRKQGRKRACASALALSLGVTLFAGCSSGGTGAAGGSGSTEPKAAEAPKGPLKISMMIPFWNPEPPKKDSDAIKMIEQYTNTKLDITWVPRVSSDEKLNASIASGDLPNMIYNVTNLNRKTSIVNAIRAGMFWEIGPYLKDYPNLKKLSQETLDGVKIDGKVYGLYVSFPQARDGIVIRQDWLDNLGLKPPKTLEELMNVVKAFTFNDPDKNGKNDTYAFGTDQTLGQMRPFLIYNGGPNQWEVKDGKVIPEFMSDQFLDMLKMFKRFYDDGSINKDFAVLKNADDTFRKGKTGMFFGPLDSVERAWADLLKNTPGSKFELISRIQGPKGERVATRGAFPDQYLFPKTSIKTEEQLKQILAFADKLGDKKMQDLLTWGIEGVHYKMENGKPVRTDAAKFADDIYQLIYMSFDKDSQAMKGDLPPLVLKAQQMQEENLKIAVPNPAQALISKTLMEKGSELDKIISDAKVKFVMGQIDEAGWKKAVEQWSNGGGNQMIQEYTEQLALVNKK